ncbi:ATP-binding protein [Roseomonas sp. GC11]|uniref:ATP-binding protein n=1 Tax=Roseomonas sp. GC11 TaxID=2950546 RepID=UPI00210D28D3|nr:ATP-binding protein [Roseomonas sp. GC11]MCQ4160715.1 ATP-binding protein [Roseomonas sp. GC11]
MHLDSATLLLVSTLLSIFLGALWLGLSLDRPSSSGQREWGIAILILAVAAMMLALRGRIADFLSIDIANALSLVSMGLSWCGARRFDGRPCHRWVMIAPPLIWLALRAVPGLTDLVEVRVIIMSVLGGPIAIAIGWEFWRNRQESPTLRGLLGLAFGLQGLSLLVARPTLLLFYGHWTAGSAFPTDSAVTVVLLISMMQGTVCSFALLALFREREERRAVAAAAAAQAAAEQASAAKSRFLASMSHELRTPLNGVLGLAQVLALRDDLPEAVQGHLAVIEGAGRHLLALVNDVLDLAQVEAGQLTLERAPVPLRPLAEGALALVSPAAAHKRLELRVEIAPGCPVAVLGDARRLNQLLLNLLGNAVKFTPPGGHVGLSFHPLPRGGLRCEVLDSGPGIPAAQRARLFREFQRLEGASAAVEGHGLGLAIAAALVAAMGGRIGVTAGPGGQGSRFWAELPLPPAVLRPRPAAPAVPPAFDTVPRHVLVVDDIGVNRVVAQALLQADGHHVSLASGGEDALAVVATADPPVEVVLLDLQMPGLDGWETARRLRRWQASQPVPRPLRILALSAEVGEAERQACLAAGMDGHVAKPVERIALQAALGCQRQALPVAGG